LVRFSHGTQRTDSST